MHDNLQAEDAVCLADYCDIIRCEVLMSQDFGNQYLNDHSKMNTDVEIWRETTAYRTALVLTGPRDLVKVINKEEAGATAGRNKAQKQQIKIKYKIEW